MAMAGKEVSSRPVGFMYAYAVRSAERGPENSSSCRAGGKARWLAGGRHRQDGLVFVRVSEHLSACPARAPHAAAHATLAGQSHAAAVLENTVPEGQAM